MSKAPGLLRRKTGKGVAFYWIARRVSKHAKDYGIRSIRLPDDEDAAAAECRRLSAELREWLAQRNYDPEFTGTVGSLIDCYRGDPDSPYHAVKANTRRDYDDSLDIVKKAVGGAVIEQLTRRDFSRWYGGFKAPAREGGPERLRRAHGCMKLLRTVASYGVSMRYPGSRDMRDVLSEMRFPMPAPREESMTYEQAEAIIDKALMKDRRSIALAQALQFETTLRQRDVIGEWMLIFSPSNEEAKSDKGGIASRGHRWANGVLWSDISPDMILRKKTTKTGTHSAWNLTLCPLVMKVLAHFPPEERVGPLVVSEASGRPYRQNAFGKEWRAIADEAGIPRSIWNMDSRSGGLTEADEAGADPHDIQRHATHSDLRTTGRYVRRNLAANERVAELRVRSRKKD